jgi:hypothetical protein
MRLDALQYAVGRHVLHDWEAVFTSIRRRFDVATREPRGEFVEPSVELFLGERRSEQVAIHVISEVGEFARHAPSAPTKRHVETNRVLGMKIGIAHLERKIALVRPVVEQLFERRAPCRARRAERNREAIVSRRRSDQ